MNMKQICKMFCYGILLVAMLCATGCFAGLGDWKHELGDGYAIVQSSSNNVSLVHYPENRSGGTVVIPDFYVTEFSVNQQYIGVCGVVAAGNWDKDSGLASEGRLFYLIRKSDGSICGMYSNEKDYLSQCDVLDVGQMETWRSTADLGK